MLRMVNGIRSASVGKMVATGAVLFLLSLYFSKNFVKCALSGQKQSCDDTNICGQIEAATNYSKITPPTFGHPCVVEVVFDVKQILEVDGTHFTVSLDMVIDFKWQEPRLSWPGSFEPIDTSVLDHIWTPDIYIQNLKTIRTNGLLSKFEGLWSVNETCLLYSVEAIVTIWCDMRFDSFPWDSHDCKFQLGSYSFPENILVYKTIEVFHDDSAKNVILDYSLGVSGLDFEDQFTNGAHRGFNYSMAGFQLCLRRHAVKYLMNYYFPSGLFVLTSWVSFLIPPDSIPGRMGLLVTLFLVIVNLLSSIMTFSPTSENITAISAWTLACIVFIFASFLGYAIILVVLYQNNEFMSRLANSKVGPKNMFGIMNSPWDVRKAKARKIDTVLLIIMPILFMCFNVYYWYDIFGSDGKY